MRSLCLEGECHFDELVFVRTTRDGPEFTPSWSLGSCITLPKIITADYICPSQFERDGKPYIGNFGAARQFSFDIATGKWRMFLDADDILEWEGPGEPWTLRRAIAVQDAKGVNFISLPYYYSKAEGVTQDRPCIWRWINDKGHPLWYWDGPLHELVEPTAYTMAVNGLRCDNRDGGWAIVHDGAPEESHERNLMIIKDQLSSASPKSALRMKTSLASILLHSEEGRDKVLEGEALATEIVKTQLHTVHGLMVAQDLIWHLLRERRLGEAEILALRCLDAYPKEQISWLGLARVKKELGQPEKALSYYREAYAPKEEGELNFNYRSVAQDQELQGRTEAAHIASRLDLWEEAEKYVLDIPKELGGTILGGIQDYYTRGKCTKQAAIHISQFARYQLSSERVHEAIASLELAPPSVRSRPEFQEIWQYAQRRVSITSRCAEVCDQLNSGDLVGDASRAHSFEVLEEILQISPDCVVDLGCNTGWLCRKTKEALPNCHVIGRDLGGMRVEEARRRDQELGLGGEYYVSDLHTLKDREIIDDVGSTHQKVVIVCSEVIEHLGDLTNFKGLLRDLYLSPLWEVWLIITTPDVERYQWLCPSAGTFNIAPEFSKLEHVRSYGVHELVREFSFIPDRNKINIRPVNAIYATAGDECLHLMVIKPDGEQPKPLGRLDIVAPGYVDWGPFSHINGHAGGSEQAVIHLAPQLASLGYDVHVWAAPINREAFVDGVAWHYYKQFDPGADRDALIVWRRGDLLEHLHNVAGGRYPIFFWAHDIPFREYGGAYQQADVIWPLSKYHRDVFLDYGCETFDVLQNGVELEGITATLKRAGERYPHRMIYGSGADRGLFGLLRMWPEIREAVPDAELHVCYRRDTLRISGNPPGFFKVADAVEDLLERYKDKGVIDHGGMKHQEFLELAVTCSVWAYPATFCETSCIVAMEMQALGVTPVTNDLAALAETVLWGDILPFNVFEEEMTKDGLAGPDGGTWFSQEGARSGSYLKLLIHRLKNPTTDPDRRVHIEEALDHYSWKRTATMFRESIERRRAKITE